MPDLKLKLERPLVSIIVPTLGRPQLLRCVRSIVQSTYPNLQLILVGELKPGPGKGGGEAQLRSYGPQQVLDAAELACKERPDMEVSVILGNFGGPSPAKNAGIAVAEGKYITFQDDDDVALPDKIQVLVGFLEEFPRCYGAFGTYIVQLPDGHQVLHCGGPPDGVPRFETLVKANYIGSSAIIYKNPRFYAPEDDSFLFDEDLSFGEDYNLWLRIAMRFPLGFLAEDMYIWKRGGETICEEMLKTDWQAKVRKIQDWALKEYERLGQSVKIDRFDCGLSRW